MFEEVINEARMQVSTLLQQKHSMAPDEADKTAEIIGKSFIDIVKQQAEKKDFSVIKEIFSGNVTALANPEVQKMIPLLATELNTNGIDAEKAVAVSATITPELFNIFNEKVMIGKQNGMDIPSLIEKFSGGFGLGNMGALMNMAGSFMKGGKSGMMADLLSKFSKK